MDNLTNADLIKAYDRVPQQFIEDFGEHGDLTRQYLLNPALFELLGDVRGNSVLDAGCGQGYLARLLARQGATVTGIEPVDAFIRYARVREEAEPLGIDYVQADLSTWTPERGKFDAVVANMVLMDIVDYEPALLNCVAALKPDGKLIFSIIHPCFEEGGAEWKNKGYVAVREYFAERAVEQTYGWFIHRTLSTYLNSVARAGCSIEQVLEPSMDAMVAARHDAERYAVVPGYLIVAATKRSAFNASAVGQT